jgi:hypothetical protein
MILPGILSNTIARWIIIVGIAIGIILVVDTILN